MKTYPLGCCEFHFNAVSFQRDGIISRPRRFIGMRKQRMIAARWIAGNTFRGFDMSDSGHHQYVAKIANARAAEMSVRESNDDRIGIMISRAPVPALGDVYGSELHSAERNVCSEEHMPMKSCSNEWIDIVRGTKFAFILPAA